MHRLSDISNEKKYDQAADDFTRYFLQNCNKPVDNQHDFHTGLPAWGSHTYWSCFQDRAAGDMDGSGPHEILLFRANWQDMYQQAPEAVRLIADRVWQHHIKYQTGFMVFILESNSRLAGPTGQPSPVDRGRGTPTRPTNPGW